MKRLFHILIPLLLSLLILISIGWYFLKYDPELTRDLLLKQARYQDEIGNHSAAVWFYDLAYLQSDKEDSVALELAQQYISIGNFTKAEYTLSHAIADGGNVELYIALCNTYVQQNKLLDAVTMLNNVADPAIKEQLSALRPQAPVPSHTPGNYSQYIQLRFTSETGLCYISDDRQYPSLEKDLFTQDLTLSVGETLFYGVSVAENGLVSPLGIYSYVIGGIIEQVHFADASFEAAVRQQLQLEADVPIYTNDLWNITEFTIPADAKSYADLPRFAFLEKLTIDSGIMDELVHISEFTNLKELTIKNTNVSADILNRISQFRLEKLTLSKCNIYNITALSSIGTLTHLDLSNNSISSIAPLTGLSSLQKLDLHHNNIADIGNLSALTNLTELNISQNALKTLAPLSVLKALVKLDASANQITDLGNITQLTALSTLVLSENDLTNLVQLAGHATVETLNVSGNMLTDISPLATLPALKYLDFSYNQVSEIPMFKKDCALVSITGIRNNLTDLKNLAGLKNLNIVNVEYNEQIISVDPLAECPILLQVYIYGTSVTDVEKLKIHGIAVNFDPTTQS